MVEDLDIQKDEVIERDIIYSWFKTNYPLVKSGTISAHMIKLSINAPSRIHYNVDPNGNDDLLFQIDSKKFRLYDPSSDPDPIYFRPEKEAETNGHDEKEEYDSEFAYERDLQNFLSKTSILLNRVYPYILKRRSAALNFRWETVY